MVVRRRTILALWRLYLARIGKRHSRFAITMPGLVVLVGLWRGWDHPFVPMLGGSFFVILALSPAMMMMQEKLTGSLRFVGSLPISGQEHAASRVLTAATMATPAALAGAVALILYPVVPFAAVAPAALANWALLTVVSIFGTALHYRYPFGYVVQLVLWPLFAFIVAVYAIEAWSSRFPSLVAALLSQAGLIGLGAILAAGVVTAAWWAVRTIVRLAPVYMGEADDELLDEMMNVERKWGRKKRRP